MEKTKKPGMILLILLIVILTMGYYGINSITGLAVAEDEVFGSLIFAFFMILIGLVFYLIVIKMKMNKRKRRILQFD